MDLADLKRRALAAREFQKAVGPQESLRQFTLRVPTPHEVKVAASRAGLSAVVEDQAAHVLLQRALLVPAVVAWSGVTVGDVLADAEPGTDALELEAGAVELVLDAHPDWEQELVSELYQRMAQRREQKDTAAKN